MIRHRSPLGPVLGLVLGLFSVVACGPGTAPAGQPPMVTLTDHELEQLRVDFNRASGDTRLVLLLSPT